MKCSNCKGTEFRQPVSITFDVDIIVDENGKFMDFSGDLNDLAKEYNIRDRTEQYTCTECETQYDPSEDEDDINQGNEIGEYTCHSCGFIFDDDADPDDPDNDISLGYVVCPHCETTVQRPHDCSGCNLHTEGVCQGELWECKTCSEKFCQTHWHNTGMGSNVECAICQRDRVVKDFDAEYGIA